VGTVGRTVGITAAVPDVAALIGRRTRARAMVGVLLAGTACGSGTAERVVGASPAPAAAVSSVVPLPSGVTASAPFVGTVGTVVAVTLAGGRVSTPSRRVRTRAGTPVRLTVTSDVADEVHVHGLDLTLPLVPGQPAVLDFTPTAQGTFEVELHGSRQLLFSLQVG